MSDGQLNRKPTIPGLAGMTQENPPNPPSRPLQNIDVSQCPSCQNPHMNLPFAAFKAKHPIYTHYFTCPVTSDPVPLVVDMTDGELRNLDATMMDCLVNAVRTGKFVVAVYWLHSGNKITLQRFQAGFPLPDLPKCVTMLKQNIAEAFGPPEEQEMTRAVGVEQIRELVGGQNPFGPKEMPPPNMEGENAG